MLQKISPTFSAFSRGRVWLICLSLSIFFMAMSEHAEAQYSSPGLFVEEGVWISASGGYSFPMAFPMWTYHGAGYLFNTSFEFPGAYFNYGLDIGIHKFTATPSFDDVLTLYPFSLFLNFDLIRFYSNRARLNEDKIVASLRSGLGAGLYHHVGRGESIPIGGFHIPAKLAYQHKQLRFSADFRFHNVLGIISYNEGGSQYGTLTFNVEYFIPY